MTFYSDALNAEGYLEFGDFMRVLSIFCFFGVDEIIKSVFTYVDTAQVELTYF
jgi:hypothetical protein